MSTTSDGGLFGDLPKFPVALPDDELRMLRSLPDYGTDECVQEVDQEDEAVVRRLERKGLVKVKRWKDDPIAIRPTMYAGRLSAVEIREVSGTDGQSGK